MAVKRNGASVSLLAGQCRVMLQKQLRYLIENVLQPLVVGDLSSLRKMRNLSGKTRNRAAAIDVVSVGRRQIPPNLADQWISPSSPRLGDRCSELLPPFVHSLADHLGNERFFGRKMVIEASLGEPGLLHQFREADGVDTLFPEKPLRCCEDEFSVLNRLLLGNAHWPPPPGKPQFQDSAGRLKRQCRSESFPRAASKGNAAHPCDWRRPARQASSRSPHTPTASRLIPNPAPVITPQLTSRD